MAKRRRVGKCAKACKGLGRKARKRCVKACRRKRCVQRCFTKRYGKRRRRAIAPGLAKLFGQFGG